METKNKQFTRAQYLDKKCTHSEYYSQFVNSNTKYLVEKKFTKEKIKEAFELGENFNSIPLAQWDQLAATYIPVPYQLNNKMRELGDFPTQSGLVCIFKEAARQLVAQ